MVHIFTSSVVRRVLVAEPLVILLGNKHNKLTDTISFWGEFVRLLKFNL